MATHSYTPDDLDTPHVEDLAVSLRRTDSGNAEFFVVLFGARVRFDHARRRWLVWDGHRWRPDADAAVDRFALRSVRRRAQIVIGLIWRRRRRSKWLAGSESAVKLNALLSLARTMRPITDDGASWDATPGLLGVQNGVVDLRSGELRDGHPDDRITMCAEPEYNPRANCPRWERFVREILARAPWTCFELRRRRIDAARAEHGPRRRPRVAGGGARVIRRRRREETRPSGPSWPHVHRRSPADLAQPRRRCGRGVAEPQVGLLVQQVRAPADRPRPPAGLRQRPGLVDVAGRARCAPSAPPSRRTRRRGVAAEDLAHHGQVRSMPLSPWAPPAETRKPGDHLVEDQQRVVAGESRSRNSSRKAARRRDEAHVGRGTARRHRAELDARERGRTASACSTARISPPRPPGTRGRGCSAWPGPSRRPVRPRPSTLPW